MSEPSSARAPSAEEAITAKINASQAWPETCSIPAPYGLAIDAVFHDLYARLAPTQPPLPPSGYERTAISERRDGMLETSQWVWMVGADKDYWYHLLVDDALHVVITYRDYDHQANDDPWVFHLRAPTKAALAAATAIFAEHLAAEERRRALSPSSSSSSSSS